MVMESLSILLPLSSSPPLQNPHKTPSKFSNTSTTISLQICKFSKTPRAHFPSIKSPPQNLTPILHSQIPLKPSTISYILLADLLTCFPCIASETAVSTEQVSDKINLEAIVVSIDDFFNRNPFFVAGVTFIWLVVIPLTQRYLNKFRFISAIDAFRKLRDDPNSKLLDIRDPKSLAFLGSPNLKILSKTVEQVQFSEEDEQGFVSKVLDKFEDPANTVVCILDNFDGNSMKVAELLFKKGFKEAYAIRGGVRGKDGWLAIQENLLPPSVHIYPRKRGKMSKQLEVNGAINQQSENNDVDGSQRTDSENGNKSVESKPQAKLHSRSSSPYPNYPDLKPPSSPTPAKPQT